MADQQRDERAAWEGELFRLLVRNVRDYAIFVVDPEGLVRSWSHGAERLLGYREVEILGRTADLFFTPEDVRDGVPRQEMREALDTGRGEDDRWSPTPAVSWWCGTPSPATPARSTILTGRAPTGDEPITTRPPSPAQQARGQDVSSSTRRNSAKALVPSRRP